MLKLNIGAGDKDLPGYIPIDRKNGGEAYPLRVGNLDNLPEGFKEAAEFDRQPDGSGFYTLKDASVDEVRASHVLEHFGHRDTMKVLREWARVLKPGGVLKIAVPNFAFIAQQYLGGAPAPFQGYVMGGQIDADDHHGAIFDREKLFELMEKAGFTDIEGWESEVDDCARLQVSLNLQGRKAVIRDDVSVECAMSVPRLGFMANFFCWAENMMAPFGIRPTSYDGAFWGQCLERVMEQHAEANDPPEYILTLDYDTFFDAATLRRLLVTATNHPEADAVTCVQVKRGDENVPLLSMKDEAGNSLKEISTEVFEPWLAKAHTAHFGLTLIKTAALRKMPHPWFKGEPDKDGRWGDSRVDDDIWFWHRWAEAGNSLYVANRCTIGHGEYVILWPDHEFKVKHQSTSEFRKTGVPRGVWR